MGKNTSAYVATAIVAIIAAAVAVFAFWKIAQDRQTESDVRESVQQMYVPSEELLAEMQDNAERLIADDYLVVKLFYTRGLPHEDEPYGNLPEDGVYYAISDDYASASDLYDIIDRTFVAGQARQIKDDPLGFGPLYFDKNGRLGISASFQPDDSYIVNWDNPAYVAIPVSDTECQLKITLHADGNPVTQTVTMLKLNGVWYLDKLLI